MDRKLKQLERLAAQGDRDAQEKLANEWGRLRYVPTQDHCIEMQKCGFISGLGLPALQEGLRIWCRLLRKLVTVVYDYNRAVLIQQQEIEQEAFISLREIKEETDRNINLVETETDLVRINNLFQHGIYPYINVALEFDWEDSKPPLYQMLSAFNDALHTAYLDSDPNNFQKVYLIVRERQGQLMTILEWNTSFNFLDIPNIFRYQPHIWNHWGYGKCNNRALRLTGGWDYNPLDDADGEGWQLLV